MSGPSGEREALIAWSAVAEPADAVAGWLVERLGAHAALDWLRTAEHDAHGAIVRLNAGLTGNDLAELHRGVERLARRLDLASTEHERRAHAVGARVVTREDPGWPAAFADLGRAEPFALYVRGPLEPNQAWARSAAIVGSRSCTAYGAHVARELVEAISGAGAVTISGGAFGIDVAAHRAAIAAEAPTVAVMAGGVDRLYPVGNEPVLRDVLESGAVLSEVPPGFAPHRSRFLTRNRLIGAASITVVVEAAVRSGALSTARHAIDMVRPVGAVPGPTTSPASSGCHDLIRGGAAVLISQGRDAVELLATATDWGARGSGAPHAGPVAAPTLDFDTPAERALFDTASGRRRDLAALAGDAGLDLASARAAAGALAARGYLEPVKGGWRRVRRDPASSAYRHK